MPAITAHGRMVFVRAYMGVTAEGSLRLVCGRVIRRLCRFIADMQRVLGGGIF